MHKSKFRIVLEDPAKAHLTVQEKRPRLVTSCDNCRKRRTRCKKTAGRCEGCIGAGIDCTFRDVDIYLKRRKRTRQILAPYFKRRPKAGSLKAKTASNLCCRSRSGVDGTPVEEITSSSSSESLSPISPSSSSGGASCSTSRDEPPVVPSMGPRPAIIPSPQAVNWAASQQFHSEVPYGNCANSDLNSHVQVPMSCHLQNILPSSTYAPAIQPQPYIVPQFLPVTPETEPGEFFDPYRPSYPHPKYLKQFLTDFDNMGNDWYGLDSGYIWETFSNGTLSPMLANSIAAISARYREWPELSRGTQSHRSSTGERYCDAAKDLMQAIAMPCLDTLYSATLIAWSEYGSSRWETFFQYTMMAIGLMRQLGFTPDVKGVWSGEDRRRLLLCWWAIARMDSVMGWLTGQPMTLALAADEAIQGSPVTTNSQSNLSPSVTLTKWKRTILPFRKRMQGLLDGHRCQILSIVDLQHNLKALSDDLADLWSFLPSCMIFNPQNLANYSRLGSATEYILVHLNWHMLMIMANCPSIIRGFEGIVPGNVDASSHSAKFICQILGDLRHVDQRTALLMPCLDLHVGAATRALLRDVQSPDVRHTAPQSPRRRYLECGIGLCGEILKYMTGFWRHVDSVQNVLAKRPVWTYQAQVDEGHLGSFRLAEPESFGESQYPDQEQSNDPSHLSVYTPSPTSSRSGSSSSSSNTHVDLGPLFEPELIPRSSSIKEQPQMEWYAFVGRLDSCAPVLHLGSTDLNNSATADEIWRV